MKRGKRGWLRRERGGWRRKGNEDIKEGDREEGRGMWEHLNNRKP